MFKINIFKTKIKSCPSHSPSLANNLFISCEIKFQKCYFDHHRTYSYITLFCFIIAFTLIQSKMFFEGTKGQKNFLKTNKRGK